MTMPQLTVLATVTEYVNAIYSTKELNVINTGVYTKVIFISITQRIFQRKIINDLLVRCISRVGWTVLVL